MARILLIVVAGYSGFCCLMYVSQDQLLFFPRPNHAEAATALADRGWQTTNGGATLRGWLLPSPKGAEAPLVLYFGGNAQDIALIAATRQVAANQLFLNYRGYGSSEGEPSAAAFKADALHIYDRAVASIPHNGNVIAQGRSLGSGVATYLAAHRPIAGLILVTPYDSIANVASELYPWLPVSWLLEHHFDSAVLAPNIRQPALFLLAGRDHVIPHARSEALANVWGGPIEIKMFPSATHNSIGSTAEAKAVVAEFISRF